MKKALAVILSSVLILSVAGCGGSDSGSSDGGKEKESKVYETVNIDETNKSQIQRAQSLFCAPSNNYAVNEVSDESAVRAVLMQLRYSVSEAKLSESFLPSAAKLGESISAESWNPDDKQATQELLHQTVDSITGKDVL